MIHSLHVEHVGPQPDPLYAGHTGVITWCLVSTSEVTGCISNLYCIVAPNNPKSKVLGPIRISISG